MSRRQLTAVVLGAWLVSACSQRTEAATPYRELARRADAVVVAVASGEVEGFPAEDPPRSLWTLVVTSAPKGDVGATVRVQLIGEPVTKTGAFLAGYPPFESGAAYVLFLDRDGEVWSIVKPGYLAIDGDKATRQPDDSRYPNKVDLGELATVVVDS